MYPIGISFPSSWIDFLAERLFHNKFLFEVRCQASLFRLSCPNATLLFHANFLYFFVGNEAVHNH